MRPGRATRSGGFRAYLATQFLGAFNDNAFKLVVSLLAVNVIIDTGGSSSVVALASGLFTAPFVLFSTYAGFLADRYSKKTITVWVKVAEIVIMLVGGLAFWFRSLPLAIFTLFLMGTQSAVFSPTKYGILPELLPDEELSRGNGLVQMWTFLAIILGTAVGGQLSHYFSGRLELAGLVCVTVAVLGTLTSLGVTPVPPAGSRRRFDPLFLRDLFQTVRQVAQDRPLFLCVLGSAYFWFLGALFQMNILLYAKRLMHIGGQPLTDQQTSYLLTVIALGIGLGSVLAGRWSGKKVEFGLVPLGAMGLGLFSVLLSVSFNHYWLTLGLLFVLGGSSALYSIPLNAYIQQRSPPDSRGRILAASNFITNVGIVAAAAIFAFLQDVLRLNPALTFLAVGLASFFVIVYICHTVPEFLVRFIIWLVTATVYRIRIVGEDNLPRAGGALLVCNHVSYADGLILQASVQRVIRFLMPRSFYDFPLLKPFSRAMKTIPVSMADGPKQVQHALEEAGEALRQGNLVCIFAEGAITRTGNLLPFGKGMQLILRGTEAPVIPVYLDRVWGSIFSFEGGRILNHLPGRLPYPVTVCFGAPLPADTPAHRVRAAVEEMGAEAFRYRKDDQDLLSTRFYRQARKHPFAFCMADSSGRRLTYAKALIGAMALSRAVRRRCPDEPNIGILLPNSVPTALLNVAVTILGKRPVNLNYTAAPASVDRAIEKCGIRTVFTARPFLEKLGWPAREGMVFIEEFAAAVSGWDKLHAAVGFGLVPHRLLRLLYRADHSARIQSPATIMFSSGSTGDPKGVVLSHANINTNIEGLVQVMPLRNGDVLLGVLPLFHSFGFTGALWYPLTTGMGVVYHANPLDFAKVGELTAAHRVTTLTATPTFLLGYLRKCTPEQFASLRFVVVGAEKLKPRIAQAFRERFGLEPLEGYGCTELSPIATANVPNVERGWIHQVGRKPGTIGHPLPGVAARVVDPETFAELPPGQQGLLLIKGANVMLGYLDDEARTREVLRDGWYVTGDIAAIDPDGFITIHDRLSRFSKIAGEMVPHAGLEEEIHAALATTGESVCAVTAVPDEHKGERLAVLHTVDLDVAALRSALGARGLPNLWIPRPEAFIRVDALPLLGSGKLDLRRIRAIAAEHLAPSPAAGETGGATP